MATDGAGSRVVAYNNNSGATTGKLRTFRRTDFGATWIGPKQINTPLGPAVADIASNGAGMLLGTPVVRGAGGIGRKRGQTPFFFPDPLLGAGAPRTFHEA